MFVQHHHTEPIQEHQVRTVVLQGHPERVLKEVDQDHQLTAVVVHDLQDHRTVEVAVPGHQVHLPAVVAALPDRQDLHRPEVVLQDHQDHLIVEAVVLPQVVDRLDLLIAEAQGHPDQVTLQGLLHREAVLQVQAEVVLQDQAVEVVHLDLQAEDDNI